MAVMHVPSKEAANSSREQMSLRERKKAETRDRLARASVELLLEQGIDQTTIAEITARAGVSTRTFHNYFAHRDDPFLHYIEGFFQRLGASIESYPNPTPVIEMLKNILWDFIENPDEDMASARQIIAVAEQLSLSLPQAEKNRTTGIFENLGDVLFRKTDGALSRYQALLAVHLVLSAATAAIEAHASGTVTRGRDLKSLFDEAFDLLHRGLG
ncbi:TetR/AcrR family transcriptional regulator [Corynebacterium anserum]|uniref:TetR family transcriptional regulator n=1 Tax=Corynebacterium anserum TaxID=2684406 RepID=A0A7G7YPG5_9CORY|nr:TetR/AcrR family transcriptional regulator [Corynebacterium anserum]QNH96385.1 TetR family transcriptional regulator [Corynebacterium anserum]